MLKISNLIKKTKAVYDNSCLKAVSIATQNSKLIVYGLGTLLFVGGLTEQAFAISGTIAGGGVGGIGSSSGSALQACNRILAYIESGFGALVASVAGIGAIVAAAVGGFKAAWSLLVVSIGSFILRAYLTLFHNGC